jgi:hypothetical protein
VSGASVIEVIRELERDGLVVWAGRRLRDRRAAGARNSVDGHGVGWQYDGRMDCSWPGCPNVAGRDPVPHLVDVPNAPDEDDRPVYLCAEHRAAFDHAFGQVSDQPPGPEGVTPAMMSFMVGLTGDRSSTPSLGVRPQIPESIKGSTPRIPAPPSEHGGFDGRDADVFDHAFTVCYDETWRAVTADPPGSGPPLYSARHSVPLAAIGSVARDDDEAMRAVRAGCLAGQNSAFSDAGVTPPRVQAGSLVWWSAHPHHRAPRRPWDGS